MKRIILVFLMLAATLLVQCQTPDNGPKTVVASGTDTYTITSSAPTIYTLGESFKVKFTNANTGPATLNRSGKGAKAIKKNGNSDLSAGDIVANQIFILVYDGTNYQITGSSGTSSGLAVNTFTASHILALTDVGKTVEMNVASANNVTIPLNATVAFSINTEIPIVQYGSGLTTVVATGGVTINSSSGSLDSPGQYSVMVLKKRGTDEWYLWNGTAGGGLTSPVNGGTGIANNSASTLTISGSFPTTLTLTGATGITLPTAGTLATLAGSESLTNKKLGSLTSNGFVTTTGGDGTLSIDATTYQASGLSWLLGSGGTLSAANTITGTTSNTLKYVFNSLGTTQTNGAGHWLSNTTAAALGAQQISPSITYEGQGWKTGTSASQSVKFTEYVLPIQGGAAAQGLFTSAASIDGGAYSTVYSARSDGYFMLNGGTAGNPYLSFGGSADLVFSRAGVSSTGLEFYFPSSSTNTYGLRLTTSSNMNWSSGTGGVFKIDPGFAPSANAGNVIYQLFSPTINMSGTSSGNVSTLVNNSVITSAKGNYTFIDHNPTVTSITGTHLAARFVSGSVLIGGTTLTTNAALDVQSTTQAFMPPRMTTTQRDAISSPAEGMMIYDTTTHKMAYYNGTIWVEP